MLLGHMDFNLRFFMADKSTLRALVGLPMNQLVFGQVVFADERLVAHRTSKVPLSVGGSMLAQRRVLSKALVTQVALVGQLLGVRSMVGH